MVPLQQVNLQEIEEKISAENVCWLCFLITAGSSAETEADWWVETTRTRPRCKRSCVIKNGLCERGQGRRCVLDVVCGWRRIQVDTWLCALLYESMDVLADLKLGDRPKEGSSIDDQKSSQPSCFLPLWHQILRVTYLWLLPLRGGRADSLPWKEQLCSLLVRLAHLFFTYISSARSSFVHVFMSSRLPPSSSHSIKFGHAQSTPPSKSSTFGQERNVGVLEWLDYAECSLWWVIDVEIAHYEHRLTIMIAGILY